MTVSGSVLDDRINLLRGIFGSLTVAVMLVLAGTASAESKEATGDAVNSPAVGTMLPSRDEIVRKYAGASPQKWSEELPGIVQTLGTQDNVVALTLDLCGGNGDSFDRELAEFLVRHELPATFFINSRWIRKNPDIMNWLASIPIFELEGHGLRHVPASMNGRAIYGIEGTRNAGELYDEVIRNADDIERATGKRPRFFRSGTAYYDELAVQLIRELGVLPIGFRVLGDAGATYSEDQVFAAVSGARGGDVIIAHANHPEKATGRGLMRVLPELRARGFKFVKLNEYLVADKKQAR